MLPMQRWQVVPDAECRSIVSPGAAMNRSVHLPQERIK